MFRLAFGSKDLDDAGALQTLFKTVYRSINSCPADLRNSVCQQIVLSGTFPENFGTALEANIAACLSQQQFSIKDVRSS